MLPGFRKKGCVYTVLVISSAVKNVSMGRNIGNMFTDLMSQRPCAFTPTFRGGRTT